MLKPVTSAKFTKAFVRTEQRSEFKAVEVWQPTNHNNIDAASVVLCVASKT